MVHIIIKGGSSRGDGGDGRVDPSKRVVQLDKNGEVLHRDPEALERRYQQDIEEKRKLARDGRSSKKGKGRITHSIPAELFHGKIKESGDPHFWDDPKNVKRHARDCRIDTRE